jgi:hypothetical protein
MRILAMSEAYLTSAAQLRRLAETISDPAAREQMLAAAVEYEVKAVAAQKEKTGPRGGRMPQRSEIGRAEQVLYREPSEWVRTSRSAFKS